MPRLVHIGYAGCDELGGYTAAGGARVKHGVLLRTGSLHTLSPEDRTRLEQDFHVAVVADFRMSVERERTPDPALRGAENLSLPVMEPEDRGEIDQKVLKLVSDPNTDRYVLLKASYEAGLASDRLYVDFLFTPRGQNAFRTFFERLLTLPEGRAVLWHCADGKDRTGLAAMLILTALGADRETIYADYLLTNDYNAQKLSATRARLERAPLSPELKELALFGAGAVFERYMTYALEAMEERCGSPTGYLEQVLGIGAAEREVLRRRYLE